MTSLKSKYLYVSLVIVQVLLILVAFPSFFLNANDAMFSITGDGIKNYFTLYSYIEEPIGCSGLFKYNSFAYPFGDYVFYTDNTPVFSVPFRWFCHHVYDLSAYTMAVFNSFILANIVFSSLLIFFIFKRLISSIYFVGLLAIVLPWVNTQVPRIWSGHFNLSCSSIVLSVFALFLTWYSSRDNFKRQILICISMVAVLFVAFFIHGYYIAVLSVLLAGMLFFLGIGHIRERFGQLNILFSIVVPAVALVFVLLFLQFADKYYGLRKEGAMGYDQADLKTNFLQLFTHYDFHTLGFPIASTLPVNVETLSYLGNIGLLSFAAIWAGSVLSINFRKRVFGIQKLFFAHPARKAIFWGGMLSLIISFGELYTTNRDGLVIFTPCAWFNNLDAFRQLAMIFFAVIAVYSIVLLLNKSARQNLWYTLNGFVKRPYKSVLVLLCTGAMIFFFIGRYSATIPNILNPFLYFHFLSRRVEQFRCLSRFAWPFFWTFNIWVMYTVVALINQFRAGTKRLVFCLAIVVGAWEMTDYFMKLRYDVRHENVLTGKYLQQFSKLNIDFNKYQAILPFPYYVVGSEDYPHTIDDNGSWSLKTMQLSLYGHLPLMACKMSRTPPEFSVALLDMVANDTLQSELKSRLNKRPILIVEERGLLKDPKQIDLCALDRPATRDYYTKANQFVARHHLTPIDSFDGIFFYEWTVQ